jgi:hypothetical protein
MKRWKAHKLIGTAAAKQYVKDVKNSMTTEQWDVIKDKIEDTVLVCPQLGEIVIFINSELTGNKVKQLIQLCEVIEFGKTFCYDTGSEALPITKDNYRSINYLDWLNEIPEQYNVE